MQHEINKEKYRRLSVAALVTGILAVFITGLYNILFLFIGDFTQNSIFMAFVMTSVFGIILSLAVTALICGSIDLKKIQTKMCNKKGRGFDITGIVIGGLFILVISVMMLSDILMQA